MVKMRSQLHGHRTWLSAGCSMLKPTQPRAGTNRVRMIARRLSLSAICATWVAASAFCAISMEAAAAPTPIAETMLRWAESRSSAILFNCGMRPDGYVHTFQKCLHGHRTWLSAGCSMLKPTQPSAGTNRVRMIARRLSLSAMVPTISCAAMAGLE